MKKILTLCVLIFFASALTAQIDSTAAFNASAAGSELLMNYLGVPTPFKLIVHTLATAIVTLLLDKLRTKRKQAKKAKAQN